MNTTANAPALPDRRDIDSREQLLDRIRAEFVEMPRVRLTFGQVQRLFGLRTAVCERVLAALVSEGTLTCTRDQRYGLRD